MLYSQVDRQLTATFGARDTMKPGVSEETIQAWRSRLVRWMPFHEAGAQNIMRTIWYPKFANWSRALAQSQGVVGGEEQSQGSEGEENVAGAEGVGGKV